MHVFVTGVGGFAGARLAEQMVAHGWAVTGLTRSASRRIPKLPPDKFHVVTSDAAELRALPDKLDAVIHAAATMPFYAPDAKLITANIEKMTHDNVDGTRRLIDLALNHGVRSFVFFSSTSVFGRDHVGVLSDASASVDPEDYGKTKIICEKMLVDVADRLPSVAFRPPGIIGAGAGGNWIASVAAKIVAGKDITFFNADAPFNNCVHIADLGALAIRLLERGFRGHEAAITSSHGTVTIRDVIDILMRGLGKAVAVREIEPARSPFTVSSEKAERIWTWQPMSTAQSLERYAAEQRAYLALTDPQGARR